MSRNRQKRIRGKSSDYVGTDLVQEHLMGMGRSFKNNPDNDQQRVTERMYLRVLSEMCMNRFQWDGLPNSIDPRFLEKVLYGQGLAVFFWYEKTSRYLALRGSSYGQWDMYDNPMMFKVIGNLLINEDVPAEECVPIWCNYMRQPDIDIVMLYAKKLANIDRSIEINSNNMRQSKYIVASEEQRLSYENFNRQVTNGTSAIFVTTTFNGEEVKALDLSVDPKSLPALISAKRNLWNECMTLLGVENNPGEDKKERMVSDEVDANNSEVLVHRATALKSRQEAAEKINRRFKMPDGSPLNITVSFINDVKPSAMMQALMPDTGAE